MDTDRTREELYHRLSQVTWGLLMTLAPYMIMRIHIVHFHSGPESHGTHDCFCSERQSGKTSYQQPQGVLSFLR